MSLLYYQETLTERRGHLSPLFTFKCRHAARSGDVYENKIINFQVYLFFNFLGYSNASLQSFSTTVLLSHNLYKNVQKTHFKLPLSRSDHFTFCSKMDVSKKIESDWLE